MIGGAGSWFGQPSQEEFRRVAESHRAVVMVMMVMVEIMLLYVCLRGTYIARSISKVNGIVLRACAVELLPAYDPRRHA